jgi:two-component system, NtrC family, response regulator HydG
MATKTRVLIADDIVESARSLSDRLAQAGYVCEVATDTDSGLDSVRRLACDAVICDVQMEGSNEFELLDQIRALQPQLPVIVGARTSSLREAVDAVKRGAFQYLEKPFIDSELLSFILLATTGANSYRRTTLPPRQVVEVLSGDLVQSSPIMRELVEAIALVARSSAAVLILGESGTGKERVARAIHIGGPRASQAFVAINTSAIPEQLLESEVFGHVRGAFTGAMQARRGLLLEAHGGTLLLDEIGDMPVALQPKLLRVLQFGETRAVGSDRIGHVDVRIIAATHRDLNLLVREGRFREDLRYRLNVIPLVVPPLRDRREDILPLVEQFLREARGRTPASPVDAISDDAMNILNQASWPGNVRELENTIERLVVLGRDTLVTGKDLDFLREQPPGEAWPAIENAPWTLKQMNQRYLDWVLTRTGGDKARAAGILNIDLSTLYRWERAKL